MKKKQLTRERIFRNNQVILTFEERNKFANEEHERQIKKLNIVGLNFAEKFTFEVDIIDPFIAVVATVSTKKPENIRFTVAGYSKRMPNDIPNDRIGIQVAVSRLIKRLQDK